jgi:serine/threonine protein phosphatase PrpC
MQGWRKGMEDACFILPSEDDDYPSLFAVFDGHGGLEVSNLARLVFPTLFDNHFKTSKDTKTALIASFLEFDKYMLTPAAAAQIKTIRQQKNVTF